MAWRDKYKVHPAADVFPMMSDVELDALAADIKANGLQKQIDVRQMSGHVGDVEVLDGRNRLEAMERVGINPYPGSRCFNTVTPDDPTAYIISANLHRRHMLKSERAEAIVALVKMSVEKPDHGGPVSKGGRGKKNPVKAKALEINAALPKEQQVSEPTIKRAMAKAEGKTPKPKPEHDHQVEVYLDAIRAFVAASTVASKSASKFSPGAVVFTVVRRLYKVIAVAEAMRDRLDPPPPPRSRTLVERLDAARRHYLNLCADVGIDLDEEQRIIFDAFREILSSGKRMARNGQADRDEMRS